MKYLVKSAFVALSFLAVSVASHAQNTPSTDGQGTSGPTTPAAPARVTTTTESRPGIHTGNVDLEGNRAVIVIGQTRVSLLDTGGFVTGAFFIFQGYRNFTLAGGDGASGLTSSLGGISTALGAISVAHAAGIPQTAQDPLRQFRMTSTYTGLVNSFGQREAERITRHIYAGWTVERIIRTHVTDTASRDALLALVTTNQNACSAVVNMCVAPVAAN